MGYYEVGRYLLVVRSIPVQRTLRSRGWGDGTGRLINAAVSGLTARK